MPANTKLELSGGCPCGSVRYTLAARPMFVHCCHCRWCQRETGSAFAVNALIETNHVHVTSGEVMQARVVSNSGHGQVMVRCADCRFVIWSHYGAAGERVAFVRVGTLDHPDHCPPDIHIFTASKQRWVVLDGSVPVMAEYYQRSKYWPEDSVARYKAVLQT